MREHQMFRGHVLFRRCTRATLFAMLCLFAVQSAGATDWPYWRGPAQNGMAYEKAVVTEWEVDGKNQLWRTPVGGRTTPVFMDGRLFFIAPAGEGETIGEQVVCLDAETGKVLWQQKFNVFLTTIVEQRVGWTAVVADPETRNIYAHGTGGEFFCFDRDGKILWKRSLTEMYGRVSGYGGRLHTPIVDEDKVIISFVSSNWGNHGKPGHRYVAFDKKTGDVIWWAMPGGRPLDTTYSVPVVTVINGVRMLIAANADGWVYGMKVRTGEKVWSYKLSKRGINSSIVVDGHHAYVTHGEENYTTTDMGAVLCIDASKKGDITETGTVWRKDSLTAGYTSPAIANGRLYVVDNAATMHCFDANTGKKYWKRECGRVGKGSPTVTADGVIYIGTVNGRFSILKDEGDKCTVLHTKEFPPVDDFVVEIYGSPAVVDGRVYFQTRYDTYCLGMKGAKVETVALPPMTKEAKPDPTKPGSLLLVPGEVTLSPGEEQNFAFRIFDHNGQLIETPITANWRMRTHIGPAGDWSADGKKLKDDVLPKLIGTGHSIKFSTKKDQGFRAGLATISLRDSDKMEDFMGASVRIRVSPDLPIKENFDAMVAELRGLTQLPGWVGIGKKAKIVELDGNRVLEKLAPKERPNVPFMRMRAYSGPPIPIGYTVQCDLMGKPRARGRKVRPDMGLINCRYTMKMMGQEKLLRLETWSPMPRLRVDLPMDWKTDVWHRAKMRVEMKDGKAWVRAKVWPRDEAEPKNWLIEMFDPSPNLEGSPGLYAYSNGTKPKKDGPPVYFDNYQVYKNEM